jgi:hypothetical protein
MGRCPSPTLLWSVPHFSFYYKPSPLQAHWGRWPHTRLLRPAYLQFVWRSAPPPLSIGACYSLATVTSLSFSKHTEGGAATPAFSGLLVYLQVEWGVPLPYSPELMAPCPLLIYYSVCFFSLFFLGGGQSAQGAMLIYRVLLSLPGFLCFPSSLRAGVWWHGSPPSFSI